MRRVLKLVNDGVCWDCIPAYGPHSSTLICQWHAGQLDVIRDCTMYFWKTSRLVAELKNGSLNESDLKNYYLATSLFFLVGYYLALLVPPENESALVVEAIGSIVVTILGVNYAFKANGGNAGSCFVNKAVSISVPLFIKVLVGGIVLGIVLVLLEGAGVGKSQSEWITSISIVVMEIGFFWRLITHIRNANA